MSADDEITEFVSCVTATVLTMREWSKRLPSPVLLKNKEAFQSKAKPPAFQ